tara:strand:- start:3108 stop:3656 length:549 start_codon:yes stop_codon:yes gene_type:complete
MVFDLSVKKKGQVHISETMLVLFIIVVLMIMGMIMYYKFSIEGYRSKAEELSEREATIMLAKAMNLDEIACTNLDCLDTSKFLPFEKAVEKDFERFRLIFGRKKITVERIYPVPDVGAAGVECNVVKYIWVGYPQNCAKWTLYWYNPENEPGRKISSVVSLYFPEIDEYMIGRLEIEHYGSI